MVHESIYQNLFELSPEAIVILDSNGFVVDVNRRLIDWLGYSPEEVRGVHVLKLPYIPAKSRALIAAKFAKRLLGKPLEPYELEFTAKNGSTVIGRIYAKIVVDPKTEKKYDLAMISDVTEEALAKKRFEEQQKKLEQKVIEFERINKLMIGRELKMKQLKDRIRELERKKGIS